MLGIVENPKYPPAIILGHRITAYTDKTALKKDLQNRKFSAGTYYYKNMAPLLNKYSA